MLPPCAGILWGPLFFACPPDFPHPSLVLLFSTLRPSAPFRTVACSPHFGIAHALCLGLAPWLAAEVPYLVETGIVKPKS